MAEPAPSRPSRARRPSTRPARSARASDTKLLNPFGGQLTVAQYWCNRCRTGFDYIKWEDHGDDPGF